MEDDIHPNFDNISNSSNYLFFLAYAQQSILNYYLNKLKKTMFKTVFILLFITPCMVNLKEIHYMKSIIIYCST